jgi:probable HAF family extracellular repeat protein
MEEIMMKSGRQGPRLVMKRSDRPRPSRKLWALVGAIAAVGLSCVTAGPALATTYSITDLGSLGAGGTYGLAINASGQVTGSSVLSTEVQVPCPPQKYGQPKKCFTNPEHAFLWSAGTMNDLGTLGGLDSQGVAISDSGQVVGWSAPKSGGRGVAFLSNGHNMTAVSGMAPSGARGINDSGEIAGQCGDIVSPEVFACVVSKGTVTALPELNLGCFSAIAINNSGQVLANCYQYDNTLAVVWTNDSPTVLPTLGGAGATATAIDGLGQVVGTAQTGTGAFDGFLWSNGTMTDLGNNFSPAAINDNGVIVGGQLVDSGGTLQNLNNLIPAGSPYQIQAATGINDNGQIVANAVDTATGQDHGLLLRPN